MSLFTVAAGERLVPHQHPTHEYWYAVQGRGRVQVAGETDVLEVGDLLYTPPNTPHTVIAEGDTEFRAFCVALSYPGQGSQHIDVELPPADGD
jgi:quercetin dioxygenase-like cupin family protein